MAKPKNSESNGSVSLSDDNLYKLYQQKVGEQQYYLSSHQKIVAFYSGLISALLGATFAGFIKSEAWNHYLFLMVGPFSIIFIARLANAGAERYYQRFLESITYLAKLEYDFGLSERRNKESDKPLNWTANEQYITDRHLKSRSNSDFHTSKMWVDAHLKEGYNSVTIKLFRYFMWLAWFLFAVIILKLLIVINLLNINLLKKICECLACN